MYAHRIAWGVGFALFATGALAFAALSNADKEFLMNVAKADMEEAHEGQMAQAQGQSQDVKSFGQTLDQDHTQNFQQLETLAAKEGVTLPTGIDTAKIATIKQLEHLKGAAFDHAFAKDEITTHRQAIAEFKREAEHGTDPDVKAFAQQTIPVLQKHLTLAEQAAKPGKP
jgi:putative membrane protein